MEGHQGGHELHSGFLCDGRYRLEEVLNCLPQLFVGRIGGVCGRTAADGFLVEFGDVGAAAVLDIGGGACPTDAGHPVVRDDRDTDLAAVPQELFERLDVPVAALTAQSHSVGNRDRPLQYSKEEPAVSQPVVQSL